MCIMTTPTVSAPKSIETDLNCFKEQFLMMVKFNFAFILLSKLFSKYSLNIRFNGISNQENQFILFFSFFNVPTMII